MVNAGIMKSSPATSTLATLFTTTRKVLAAQDLQFPRRLDHGAPVSKINIINIGITNFIMISTVSSLND